MQQLYDRRGDCVAHLQGAQCGTIHLNDGRLVAEIGNGGVFTLDGRHIGWLSQQRVYNRDGKLVLTTRASEGPAADSAPPRLPRPADKPVTMPPPRRAERDTIRVMPQLCGDWAEASGLAFLNEEVPPSSAQEEPPWVWRSTRYQVEGELARGAMGVVFRAYDRLTRQMVALKRVELEGRRNAASRIDPKLLRGVEPAQVDRGSFAQHSEHLSDIDRQRLALAREFRILASLRHPHIVSVLDYGFDQRGRTYLVMELLEGAHTLVDACELYSLKQRIELLGQLIQALRYLHRMGVVHRDLKPENVLLVELAGVPMVKLIDFGLAMWMRSQNPTSELAGTVGYMAPELMRGTAPSQITDIYALGVVGYEICAGFHPFEYMKSEDGILAAARYGLADLEALPLDAEARALIGEMMSPEPSDRVADTNIVLSRWCSANQLAVPNERLVVRDQLLRAAPFVGRSYELQLLINALDEAMQGEGSAWLVSGVSGVGKSRLLDELRGAALVRGMLVLRGQALDTDAQSFALWRTVLRELVLYVPLEPLEAEVLRDQIEDIEELLDTRVKSATSLDRAGHLWRLMKVVQAVFSRLQVQTLLLLDDLHWATPESLALFKRVVDGVGQRRMMVIGSVRSEERPAWLYGLEALELSLEPFGEEEIGALCSAVIGDAAATAQTVHQVQRTSGGNAFWAMEMLRSLAEESQHKPDEVPPSITRGALATTPSDLLEARLARVPPYARGPLMLAAVAGRKLDLLMLSHVMRDVSGWLRQCAAAGVIELVDDGWHFRHDKLREQLLTQIDEDTRRRFHARVADLLDKSHRGRCPTAMMAYHRYAAGQLQAALPYLLDAAEGSLAQGALTQAHDLADKVLSGAGQLRMSLHDLARARLVLIDTCQALSQPERAIEQTYRLLSEVGTPVTEVPRSRIALADLLARSLWMEPLVVEKSKHPQEVWLLVCKAVHICFRVQILFGRTKQAFELLVVTHNISRSLGLMHKAAAIRCGIAYVLAQTPLKPMARRMMTNASGVIERHGDAVTVTTMHETQAMVCINEGRWHEALDRLRRVEASAASVGDERRLLFALLQGSLVLQARGQLAAAQSKLDEVKSATAAEDDHQLFTQAQNRSGWLWLYMGRLEQAQECFDRALRGDPAHLVKVALKAGLALALWLGGMAREPHQRRRQAELHEAEELAQGLMEMVTEQRLGGHAGVFAVPAAAHVLIEACRAHGGEERQQAAQQGLALLERFSRRFPCVRPAYWLQRGRYEALTANRRAARASVKRSAARATHLGMPLDRAMAAIELAYLDPRNMTTQRRAEEARHGLIGRGALGCLQMADR